MRKLTTVLILVGLLMSLQVPLMLAQAPPQPGEDVGDPTPTPVPTEEVVVDPTEEPIAEPTAEAEPAPDEGISEGAPPLPSEGETVTIGADDVAESSIGTSALPGYGDGNSVIHVQNTHLTDAADWVVAYYTSAGTKIDGSDSGSLQPYTAHVVDVGDDPLLGTGFNGSAVLDSTAPLAAMVETTYTNNPSQTQPDNTQQLGYSAFEAGADMLMFPYVHRSNRITQVAIQNTSSSAVTAYLTWVDTAGTAVGNTQATIQPQANRFFDLTVSTDTAIPSTIRCSGCTFNGAIIVTSTTESLAGVASTFWAVGEGASGGPVGWDGAYNGAVPADAANEIAYPLVYRAKYQQNESSFFTRYSDCQVMNPNLTSSISITVKYIKQDGTEVVSWDDSLGPGQRKGFNTQYASAVPTAILNNFPTTLGPNFVGAMLVETDDPGDVVVGACFAFWDKSSPTAVLGYAGGYNAVSTNVTGTTIYYPATYRSGGGPNRWSQIQFYNPDPSNDATITIYGWANDKVSGGTANADIALSSLTVAAGGVGVANTKYSSGMVNVSSWSPLGTAWEGSMAVVSNRPLIGVSVSINGSPGRANSYNAILK